MEEDKRRNMQKKRLLFFTPVLIVWALGVSALSVKALDLSAKGSVEVTIALEGRPVSGGTLTIYRVGMINKTENGYEFVLTGDFRESGVSLNGSLSSVQAQKLNNYAENKKLEGTKTKAGKDGRAVFSNLETGLYLIVQKEAAEGYSAISPFLAAVPMAEDGSYIYNVNATPKVEIEKTQKPSEPSEPTKPTKPGSPLPQTGQQNWPVPVLAASGLALLLSGWLLRHEKGKPCHEK